MPLFPEPTALDRNRAELQSRVDKIASLANSLAREMNHTNQLLWGLEESELLDLLSDSPAVTNLLMSSNENLGGALNAHLNLYDNANYFNRVPAERGRTDIDFDPATGRFVVLAPAPESPPEP